MMNKKLLMLLFIVLNAPHPLEQNRQAPASARDEAEQYMEQERKAERDRLVDEALLTGERARKTRNHVPELVDEESLRRYIIERVAYFESEESGSLIQRVTEMIDFLADDKIIPFIFSVKQLDLIDLVSKIFSLINQNFSLVTDIEKVRKIYNLLDKDVPDEVNKFIMEMWSLRGRHYMKLAQNMKQMMEMSESKLQQKADKVTLQRLYLHLHEFQDYQRSIDKIQMSANFKEFDASYKKYRISLNKEGRELMDILIERYEDDQLKAMLIKIRDISGIVSSGNACSFERIAFLCLGYGEYYGHMGGGYLAMFMFIKNNGYIERLQEIFSNHLSKELLNEAEAE